MKKIIYLLVLLLIVACNKPAPKEINTTTTSIEIDTNLFHIDTIKVVKMKHLPASNLYRLHCQMCHGLNGTGNGVKARYDTSICPYDLSKETKLDKEVYYVVVNGLDDKMPKHQKLQENEVWLIVFYIKAFKK